MSTRTGFVCVLVVLSAISGCSKTPKVHKVDGHKMNNGAPATRIVLPTAEDLNGWMRQVGGSRDEADYPPRLPRGVKMPQAADLPSPSQTTGEGLGYYENSYREARLRREAEETPLMQQQAAEVND